MILEKLNKVLPVYMAEVANNRWETTDKGISYLRSSAIPGEIGNSIFYGHNWKSILADLPTIEPGDMIVLSMDDGSALRYEVEFIQIVEPTDTNILNQSEDMRLTLYTCTGFLDSKRFVVTAILRS